MYCGASPARGGGVVPILEPAGVDLVKLKARVVSGLAAQLENCCVVLGKITKKARSKKFEAGFKFCQIKLSLFCGIRRFLVTVVALDVAEFGHGVFPRCYCLS